MKKPGILIGVFSVVLFLLLGVGLTVRPGFGEALAQEPEPGDDLPAVSDEGATRVGGEIPIQGRLTDADGNPINGTRTITFLLYTIPVGGTSVCHDVDTLELIDGLFSTSMSNCTAAIINGQQLYLGIQVQGDPEMEDRQPILPVPYAWSLRPGAIISGTLSSEAVLLAENWANTGWGLRGDAKAASGVNYGVIGMSSSPEGFGGYFNNDTDGYAVRVDGGMRMDQNAGSAKVIHVGDHYRDNAIVAWAKILGTGVGSISAEYGISAVDHYMTGAYKIYTDISATNNSSLIPMAIAEIDTAPTSAATIRIISVNQMTANTFNIYINNGNGDLVDNDFVFMVTAR